MKLVAIVRRPTSPEDAARAVADATGLTLVEARMRLAPEPPAALARLEAEASGFLVAALRKAGLAALAIDLPAPSDQQRTVARTLALEDTGATLTPRAGDSLRIAWEDVAVILRGLRGSRSEVETTEKSRSFSLGTAVATGGMKLTRSSRKTVRTSEESMEQVVLVYDRGGRGATIAESQLDYSCLGPRMQPSSTANMLEIAAILRERAKGAFYDERLLRLGRRPLPLLASGDWRFRTSSTSTTLTTTSGVLDALAEIMRQAVMDGLLP